MRDHQPFLRTIAKNKDDDAPRLVYADFLDEIGDHDLARLIRDQIYGKGLSLQAERAVRNRLFHGAARLDRLAAQSSEPLVTVRQRVLLAGGDPGYLSLSRLLFTGYFSEFECGESVFTFEPWGDDGKYINLAWRCAAYGRYVLRAQLVRGFIQSVSSPALYDSLCPEAQPLILSLEDACPGVACFSHLTK